MHHPGFAGPGGYCICLHCGTRKRHEAGVRCVEARCPNCGKALVREGSGHHLTYLKRRESAKPAR
jgi:hypothetical protein